MAAYKSAAVLNQVTTVANIDSRSFFLLHLMLTGCVSVHAEEELGRSSCTAAGQTVCKLSSIPKHLFQFRNAWGQ